MVIFEHCMDSKLINRVYSEVSSALYKISKNRKRMLFFQRTMYLITGLYFIVLLVLWVIGYFPGIYDGFSTFLSPYFNVGEYNPYWRSYLLVGLIIILYPTIYFFTRAFTRFKTEEAAIMSRMVKALFPKAEFTQGAMVPINQIIDSKIFAWAEKGIQAYNYGQMLGRNKDLEIHIADIGIVEENVKNNFLKTLFAIPFLNMFAVLYQYVYKNIFTDKSAESTLFTYRGMFCWSHFKKKLNGYTVVLSNTRHTKLDKLVNLKFTDEQRIYLEDPRFAKQFVVYSTDQIEARYVLSSKLMERIVEFKEQFGQSILLSFHNQRMYLAVSNDNGLFSFSSEKLNTIQVLEEMVNDVEMALEIVTELG